MADLLVVFARLPSPGRVKTRLAATLGDVAAADLYAAFVADLSISTADPRWQVRWEVAPPHEGFASRFGLAPASCVPQEGRDLGERMLAALRRARADGFERCVLIGSDAPQVGASHVESAFHALGPASAPRADLVLGPAHDGGFWAVATAEPRDVFAGVEWSTPRALEGTLRNARALGLRTALLGTERDVDDRADLASLAATLTGDEQAAPAGRPPMAATRAALARLRVPRVG
ncbi:MAG: TIGR04282 family arsenosugar biosynthesis glycosyltransferase [Alphaproteobacteria bacterium]